jgi:hypothetical protein
MELRAWVLVVVVAGVALRCGDLNEMATRAAEGGGDPVDPPVIDGEDPELPPEQELEADLRVPVATGRFVWTANPKSNHVALIDATSFSVATLDAGFAPTYLAALPTEVDGKSGAVVINALSADVNVLLAKDTSDVTISAPLPIHASANAWAVSKSGRWAIAWSNARGIDAPDPTQGFQDVSLIDLANYPETEPRVTRLSVGYRPTRVVFAEDERRVFAVTEPGVTVIELDSDAGPRVLRDIVVSDEPAAEVEIAPSGRLAWVRGAESASLTLVDLETADRLAVELPTVVTDIDLSPDASFAIAVCRGSIDAGGNGSGAPGFAGAGAGGEGGEGGEGGASLGAGGADFDSGVSESIVVVLPVPETLTVPEVIPSVALPELVGSVVVPPGGSTVLLYTNAVASDRVTLLNVDDRSWRTLELKAPVRALFATPDAKHAVALMAPPAGSSRKGAFSLIPVARELPPKVQGTLAPTLGVAVSEGNAIVTTLDATNGEFTAYLASFPGLSLDAIELPSAPLASGILVDAHVGYIAQQHAEGRITFLDLLDASARTLTGFELGVKVIDGQ